MDLKAEREQLQLRANILAIEESNLAEHIERLRVFERRAVEANREKHRILGAIQAIDNVIKAGEQQ